MPQPSKPVEPLSADELASFKAQVVLSNDPHYRWTPNDRFNLLAMLPRVVATLEAQAAEIERLKWALESC